MDQPPLSDEPYTLQIEPSRTVGTDGNIDIATFNGRSSMYDAQGKRLETHGKYSKLCEMHETNCRDMQAFRNKKAHKTEINRKGSIDSAKLKKKQLVFKHLSSKSKHSKSNKSNNKSFMKGRLINVSYYNINHYTYFDDNFHDYSLSDISKRDSPSNSTYIRHEGVVQVKDSPPLSVNDEFSNEDTKQRILISDIHRRSKQKFHFQENEASSVAIVKNNRKIKDLPDDSILLADHYRTKRQFSPKKQMAAQDSSVTSILNAGDASRIQGTLSSFTLEDIANSRVLYRHDGSETALDSALLQLELMSQPGYILPSYLQVCSVTKT